MTLFVSLVEVIGFCSLFSSLQVNADSNIRMQRDFHYPIMKDFPVYWNVPTFMCHKHGINFEEQTKRFDIIANYGDQFRGDHVNILYDPGLFPAMLQSTKGRMVERNGGIPQLGNVTRHLDSFRNILEKLVPKDFAGIGIIDFEAWRPIFRQNWNYQTVYKEMSRDLERQKHPQWKEDKIELQAKRRFEYTSKVFMDTTLKLAKILRPKAKWGYYGFPYCFNYRSHGNMEPWCPPDVEKENNRIQWLFDESTGIYPSLYMSKKLNAEEHLKFVLGRLNEAWRVASRVSSRRIPPVYPYIWYKYYDSPDYLSQLDIYNALETTRKYKMGGAIIWGATNDVITKEKCVLLMKYLNDTLGPTILKIKEENEGKLLESKSQFIPLIKIGNKLNNSAQIDFVYREERSTTSSTPRLTAISDWYKRVLKSVFTI